MYQFHGVYRTHYKSSNPIQVGRLEISESKNSLEFRNCAKYSHVRHRQELPFSVMESAVLQWSVVHLPKQDWGRCKSHLNEWIWMDIFGYDLWWNVWFSASLSCSASFDRIIRPHSQFHCIWLSIQCFKFWLSLSFHILLVAFLIFFPIHFVRLWEKSDRFNHASIFDIILI